VRTARSRRRKGCYRWCHLLCSALVILIPLITEADDKSKSPPPVNGPKIDLNQALDINELKIEMAESQLKVRASDKASSELITYLEEFLNSKCLGSVTSTLTYSGNPTDPLCLSRLNRLTQLNPDNPVALCVRDGFAAQSCIEAYRKQRLVAFSGSNMEDVDPALKVGLSSYERSLLEKIKQDLQPLDSQWAAASSPEEKATILEAALPSYEKMLNTACRVVILRVNRLKLDSKEESTEAREVREKLLKIPLALRGEYQEKMTQDVEERLARVADQPKEVANLTALLEVIRTPETYVPPLSSSNSERVRYVLPQCFELLKSVKERIGSHPAPLCHTEGWYSPQCISAIKAYRAEMRAKAAQKAGKGKVDQGAPDILKF
jgi:hypothetical protein